MAAEETLPYGRSPSRACRSLYDTSLEQRSFFGPKNSKKSATDKLVWFSPVHSPLLSPAREKTLQLAKKKVRSSSIFSAQSRTKGSIETEEPTSPKVSCIGQVRACKKDKNPFADTSKKKTPQSKPGSMSPARFFASPGRARKWGSLFGSRKESCGTPSLSGYGEGEISCSDSSFGSHSMHQSDGTGAFLARSLAGHPEGGNLDVSRNDKVMQFCTHASDYEPEKQDIWAVGRGFSDRYTHDVTNSRVFGDTRPFAVDNPVISEKGASTHDNFHDLWPCERDKDGKRPILHAMTHREKFVQEQQQHCRAKPPASKQRLTYEELPSLHCGTSMKPDMKISVEVVPETWLWRNGEKLRPDNTLQRSCIPETSTSTGTSGEYLPRVQQENIITPVSPCSNAQPSSREGEGYMDSQVSQHANIIVDKSDSAPVDADLDPVDNDRCNPVQVDRERPKDSQSMPMDEGSHAHPILSPSCATMGVCKEESKEVTNSGEEGADGAHVDKHHPLRREKLQGEVDVEKPQISLGSSEFKNRHRRQRRVSPDVGKENYGIVLPQLVEKKLPSVHSKEDGKRLWSVFKGRKSDAFSAQPFSALILVGYEQAMASKDNIQKGTHNEEFFNGILEVGRLSFHSSAKYFQVLKSDAEFIRSRSATSHRTVITLQRCNSDPCRPSY